MKKEYLKMKMTVMNAMNRSQFRLELVFCDTLAHRCRRRHTTGHCLYEIIGVIGTAPLSNN